MRNHPDLPGAVAEQVATTLAPRSPAIDIVKREIEEELHRVEQIDAKRILIAIEKNRVLLTGEVKTWRERQAVAKTAAQIAGVAQVQNELRVTPWLF